jgi:hypothetical protein
MKKINRVASVIDNSSYFPPYGTRVELDTSLLLNHRNKLNGNVRQRGRVIQLQKPDRSTARTAHIRIRCDRTGDILEIPWPHASIRLLNMSGDEVPSPQRGGENTGPEEDPTTESVATDGNVVDILESGLWLLDNVDDELASEPPNLKTGNNFARALLGIRDSDENEQEDATDVEVASSGLPLAMAVDEDARNDCVGRMDSLDVLSRLNKRSIEKYFSTCCLQRAVVRRDENTQLPTELSQDEDPMATLVEPTALIIGLCGKVLQIIVGSLLNMRSDGDMSQEVRNRDVWKFHLKTVYVRLRPNRFTGGDLLLGNCTAAVSPRNVSSGADAEFRHHRFKYLEQPPKTLVL